MEIKALYG